MSRFPDLFAALLAMERNPPPSATRLDGVVFCDDPPPRDLRERDDLPPLWTPPAPPNRAQRRAAEREERRRKKQAQRGLWWGIDHAVGRMTPADLAAPNPTPAVAHVRAMLAVETPKENES